MGLNVFAFLHPLGKTTEEPPAWALGKKWDDGLGNKLRLVRHKTPSAGVAVTAFSPVGWTDGLTNVDVTTDISQSDVGKLAGASLIAITAAESLAGTTWAWVMTDGNLADYIAGGRGVPLGDDDFNPNVNPGTSIKTDDSVADGNALFWAADDTWGGTADLATGAVAGGVALAADGGVAMNPAKVIIQVGIGVASA
jgi:hypothetical protein